MTKRIEGNFNGQFSCRDIINHSPDISADHLYLYAERDIKMTGPTKSQCKHCRKYQARSTTYQVQLYRQAITALIPGVACLAGSGQFDGNAMAAMFIAGIGFIVLASRAVAAAEGKVRS